MPVLLVMSVMGVGGSSTVSVKTLVASALTALDAQTVIVEAPASVGVPEMVAVPSPLSVKARPAGRLPLVTMSMGRVQPVVSILAEYALPAVAAGRLSVAMVTCLESTANVSLSVADPPPLETVRSAA